MALWAIPAAVQAGTSLAQYLGRKRRPSFASTPYGRQLRKLSLMGLYPPETRRKLLSLRGGLLGQIGQRERQRIRGGLIRAGAEGSIAGVSALGELGRQRMRSLGEYSERLAIENELAKQRAKERYGQLELGYEERRRGEEGQARRSLISGLAGAGMAGYAGYQAKELIDKHPEIAPYVYASLAGVRLPYYAGRELSKDMEFPDFSTMAEDDIINWAIANLPTEKAKLFISNLLRPRGE